MKQQRVAFIILYFFVRYIALEETGIIFVFVTSAAEIAALPTYYKNIDGNFLRVTGRHFANL